jgi:hypothetical protein
MKFNSQRSTSRRNTPFDRFSRSLLLAGVVLIFPVEFSMKAAESGASPSYGELATRLLCGPLEEIQRGLTNFTSATLPHEARDLRKLMGRFRNKLDLFAFAYPAGPGDDLFLKLREDIDKGYERMGDFKDLFDAQRIELAKYDPEKDRWSAGIRPEAVRYADPQKLQNRRDKVLKWQEKFMEPARLARYRAYVCAPDGQKFHARPAKDLSRFFWGSEEGLMPRAELSGVDNFRWLAAEMLARAHRDHPVVMELRDLEGATAEKFHDFRKRVRAVVRIAEDIDIVPVGNRRAGELNKLMDELDDSFGDLNDKIVDLGLAVESGNSTKAGELREEIAADWTRLRQWQTTQNIAAALNEYAGLLRSLMPPDR